MSSNQSFPGIGFPFIAWIKRLRTFRERDQEYPNTSEQIRKVSNKIALWLPWDCTTKNKKSVGATAHMGVNIQLHCQLSLLLIWKQLQTFEKRVILIESSNMTDSIQFHRHLNSLMLWKQLQTFETRVTVEKSPQMTASIKLHCYLYSLLLPKQLQTVEKRVNVIENLDMTVHLQHHHQLKSPW